MTDETNKPTEDTATQGAADTPATEGTTGTEGATPADAEPSNAEPTGEGDTQPAAGASEEATADPTPEAEPAAEPQAEEKPEASAASSKVRVKVNGAMTFETEAEPGTPLKDVFKSAGHDTHGMTMRSAKGGNLSDNSKVEANDNGEFTVSVSKRASGG